MKLFAAFLLLVFCTFLSAPTMIGLLKKSANTSLVFEFSEEEKSPKDINGQITSESLYILWHDPQVFNGKIISENLSKHDNISSSILSPPPKKS